LASCSCRLSKLEARADATEWRVHEHGRRLDLLSAELGDLRLEVAKLRGQGEAGAQASETAVAQASRITGDRGHRWEAWECQSTRLGDWAVSQEVGEAGGAGRGWQIALHSCQALGESHAGYPWRHDGWVRLLPR
jgi:hypothetical protein